MFAIKDGPFAHRTISVMDHPARHLLALLAVLAFGCLQEMNLPAAAGQKKVAHRRQAAPGGSLPRLHLLKKNQAAHIKCCSAKLLDTAGQVLKLLIGWHIEGMGVHTREIEEVCWSCGVTRRDPQSLKASLLLFDPGIRRREFRQPLEMEFSGLKQGKAPGCGHLLAMPAPKLVIRERKQ